MTRASIVGLSALTVVLSVAFPVRALVVEEITQPGIFLRSVMVRGAIDTGRARADAMSSHGNVQRCWRDHPLPPQTRGRYVMRLLVSPEGRVVGGARSRSSFEAPELEGCLLSAMNDQRFEAAEGHSTVFLNYAMFRRR